MRNQRYRICRILTTGLLIFSVVASSLNPIYQGRLVWGAEVSAEHTSESESTVSDDSTEETDPVPVEKDVFIIHNEEDFMTFMENCRLDEWSLNRRIKLNADLNLSGRDYSDFDGISSFSGYFDGNRHTISGVYLTGGTEAVGLFHYLEQEGIIADLSVNMNISSDNSADILGGIVGVNSGTIKNCSFVGNISGNGTTGGIAGYNGSTGSIEDCKVSGTIKSSHSVGGVAGENRGILSDSVNAAEVNSDSSWFEDDHDSSTAMTLSGLIDTGTELIMNGTDIGGIAGYSDGIIAGCKNTATVGYLHTGRNIGGIVGRQSGDVINCKNTGSIYGKQDVGGIVGLMEPVLELEDAEKLNEEVDALHNDIDSLINDMDAMGDTVHTDLNDLSSHADAASDNANALSSELREVITTDVEVVNDLSSRLTYVVNHMPDVMDYLDSALDSMEKLGEDLSKVKDDVDIDTKMEQETHDPAKDARLTLLSGTGGSLRSDNMNPAEGANVKITVQPEKGYRLSSLTMKPYEGDSTDITNQVQDNTYTFPMPSDNVTIQAVFAYSGNYVAASNAGGRLELEQSSDRVRIRAIPDGGYSLQTVTAGGRNITSSFSDENGILTAEIEKEADSGTVLVEGTFVPSDTAHRITIDSTTGGAVTMDSVAASADDEVTITVSTLRNYQLISLQATGEDGSNMTLSPSGESTYQFIMPDQEVHITAEFSYVPDADTTVYAESTVGGIVEIIPNITNNDYYITMNAGSGYEVAESGIVLEIYENGNTVPSKQLVYSDLEEYAGGYRYTLNSMNYTAPIKVMGYFRQVSDEMYTVSVTSGTGGVVVADRTIVSGGDELKLAVTNESRYVLQSLTVNGEELSQKVSDGIVTYSVPDSISEDIKVVGTFSPVILIITSSQIGGEADYTVSGDQVTITVSPDTGYTLVEPLRLKEKNGADILYQKQYANSNIYTFTVPESMKHGEAAVLELEFRAMNDKATVEEAKDQITEDSMNFSDSLSQVSATTDQIRELMTDDFGEIRSAEDLSQDELDELQELLLELSDELGDSGAYAASILRSLNTIVEITTPYAEDALDALNQDLDQMNSDYLNMVNALQGVSQESRAIVDYLNALGELRFKNLSDSFQSNSVKLSAELDTILDIMHRLNDHVNQYSDQIEEDMRVINDRLNTIFDMIITRMDNLENLSNGKDYLEDHSADEEEIYDSSRITSCMNSGRINGDMNVGGITGSISREADENTSSSDSTNTIGARYIVSAIVSGCTNEGFIRVKNENGGGIAGNVSIGLIKGSLSEGSITSSEGRCMGGIAGYSTGTITDCSSKAELSGGEYIGGIAGKASAIMNSVSMAYITDSTARVGAIAAAYLPDEDASDDMTVFRRNLKDDYINNYYVSSQLYGIDGVSYASVAEPVTYSELLRMDGIDRAFKTMEILFLDEDDNLIDRVKTNYGTKIADIDFPQIQADDGDYYEWEGPDTEIVENNLVYRAVVTANVTVLQSVQKSGSKSLALAEGIYTESTIMNVEEVSMEGPNDLSGNASMQIEHIVIENSSLTASDETKLRLLDIEGMGNSVVYAYRDGTWKRIDQSDAGNYIQVTMIGTDETFCIVSEPQQVNTVLIGVLAGSLGGGILTFAVFMIVKHQRKRKRKVSD